MRVSIGMISHQYGATGFAASNMELLYRKLRTWIRESGDATELRDGLDSETLSDQEYVENYFGDENVANEVLFVDSDDTDEFFDDVDSGGDFDLSQALKA